MRKQLGLLILFGLLLVSCVYGAYRYYDPYYGGTGVGELGMYFDMFLDFLEQNEYIIDAIVFLVVFLVFAKKAFKEKFSEDKALYVVVGIALTIGIMMYERRVGYSFIVNSGWFSMVVLFLFVVYIFSTGAMAGGRLFLTSSIGLAFISWLLWTYPYIRYAVPDFFIGLAYILLFIGVGVGFYQFALGEKGEKIVIRR